ncbi:hypothetical protein BGZ58_004056, partial [Dissophora ornata]
CSVFSYNTISELHQVTTNLCAINCPCSIDMGAESSAAVKVIPGKNLGSGVAQVLIRAIACVVWVGRRQTRANRGF